MHCLSSQVTVLPKVVLTKTKNILFRDARLPHRETATLTILLFVRTWPETACLVQSAALPFFWNCQSASSWELHWLRTASVRQSVHREGWAAWHDGIFPSPPFCSIIKQKVGQRVSVHGEMHAPRQCVAVKRLSHGRAYMLRSRTCFALP